MKKSYWLVIFLFVWFPASYFAKLFFDKNTQFWQYEATNFVAFVAFAMIAEFILRRTGLLKKNVATFFLLFPFS